MSSINAISPESNIFNVFDANNWKNHAIRTAAVSAGYAVTTAFFAPVGFNFARRFFHTSGPSSAIAKLAVPALEWIDNKSTDVVMTTVRLAAAINAVCIPLAYYRNKHIATDERTVVLGSGNGRLHPSLFDGAAAMFKDFVFYVPVVLRETYLRRKVTWVSNATKEEILSYVRNPNYQNMVFIGHGTGSSFLAADGEFGVWNIPYSLKNSKSGEVFVYSCGGNWPRLQEELAQNPSNTFGYTKPAHGGQLFTDMWTHWYEVAYGE